MAAHAPREQSLRIGFDATCAGIADGARTGVFQYVNQLLRALGELAPADRFDLLFALPHPRHRRSIRAFAGSLGLRDVNVHTAWLPSRHLLRWRIPADLFTGALDLFHSPAHLGFACRGCPSIVTVHDLAYLDDRGGAVAPHGLDAAARARWATRSRFFAELAENMIESVKRAARVIAVSQATADALVSRLGVDPSKVVAVPLGVREGFHPVDPSACQSVLSRLGIDPGYLLYVGVLDPNKNLDTLVEGYAIYRRRGGHRPLLLGGHSPFYRQVLEAQVAGLGLSGQVRLAGFFDEADLAALYSAAHALAMPSPLEGFGLPAVEAMACGTPVFAADRGALPEVVGDAGLQVRSDSADAFADAMLALDEPALRARMSARGRDRARLFSWRSAAVRTRAVYRELAGSPIPLSTRGRPETVA